jgi:hypothetical protein
LSRRICGSLGIYDISKEKKINVKTPHVLNVYDRIYHKVTTTDDPVIRDVSTLLFDLQVEISYQF